MQAIEYSNPIDFQRRVTAFLEEREAENNLMLGLLPRLTPDAQHPPFLCVIEDGGSIVAAAIRTPPQKLLLARAPDVAVAIIADLLARHRLPLPGVLGPTEPARLFALAWQKLSTQKIRPGRKMRIYQLDRVIVPPAAPGSPRPASMADGDLLAEWHQQFMIDVGEKIPSDSRKIVELMLREGRLFVWDDRGLVCAAGCGGPTPHGIRINFVYTPVEHRHRGYATSAVAALSQHLLDSGKKFCFLFTDQSNRTSNNIYQRIGYQPISDVGEWRFE